MPRYFLQLSFHGKKYHGWQVQANANSVQSELNKALTVLLKKETETIGCGRTDTGVHAKKFFAHFDMDRLLNASKDTGDFIYHLNSLLPFEIAVQQILPVAGNAHARYDATSRLYRYYVHPFKNPFLNDRSYFFPFNVDIDLMNKAATLLPGSKDFECFSKTAGKENHREGYTSKEPKTNICNVMRAGWNKNNDQLVFEIQADRFLRNMVRAIVGTLLDVGEKRISVDDLKNILEQGSRSDAGTSVPPQGLFLEDVTYPFIS